VGGSGSEEGGFRFLGEEGEVCNRSVIYCVDWEKGDLGCSGQRTNVHLMHGWDGRKTGDWEMGDGMI
jgi:hypothetical protein